MHVYSTLAQLNFGHLGMKLVAVSSHIYWREYCAHQRPDGELYAFPHCQSHWYNVFHCAHFFDYGTQQGQEFSSVGACWLGRQNPK